MAEARAEAGGGGGGKAGGASGGGGGASSAGHSRAWFVPPEAWIAGTAAVASSGAPSFFFEGGNGADANGRKGKGRGKKGKGRSSELRQAPPPPNPESLPTAPADEAQRSCALTGEPFVSFFDDASGEWRYRDCLALDAAGAAAVGLPARRCLVKASALLSGDGEGEGEGEEEVDESEEEEEEDDGDEEKEEKTENGIDHHLEPPSSEVPLEQVEAALAEAAAAVGEGERGMEEEGATTRVKEEAAA